MLDYLVYIFWQPSIFVQQDTLEQIIHRTIWFSIIPMIFVIRDFILKIQETKRNIDLKRENGREVNFEDIIFITLDLWINRLYSAFVLLIFCFLASLIFSLFGYFTYAIIVTLILPLGFLSKNIFNVWFFELKSRLKR